MKKENIAALVTLLLLLLLAFWVGYRVAIASQQTGRVVSDTVRYVDTILYYRPVAKDSVVVRYITTKVASANQYLSDSISEHGTNITTEPLGAVGDSVEVVIPITQKEYEDSTYHAWVSGYAVNLDSIYVYQKREEITRTVFKTEKKRWSFGLMGGAGYGLIQHKPDVWIGIGAMYNF